MVILKSTRKSSEEGQWTQFFVLLIARKVNAGSSNFRKESFGERVAMLSKLSCTGFVTFEWNTNKKR